jgi:hypothetical protein
MPIRRDRVSVPPERLAKTGMLFGRARSFGQAKARATFFLSNAS